MDVALLASLPNSGNGLKYSNQRRVIRRGFPCDGIETLLQIRFVTDLVTILRKVWRIISCRGEGQYRDRYLEVPGLHQASDFSVVLFRPNFMLASEEHPMKTHKNQWLLDLLSSPDTLGGATNHGTPPGV